MPNRRRNQPILACARCYSLKKKCDRKVPACSRCKQASTECVGIDRTNQKEVPRSVLQYLEQFLAEIEPNHGCLPRPEYVESNTLDLGSQVDYTSENGHFYTLAVQVVSKGIKSSSTASCVRSYLGLHHEAKLFYPSERPPLKVPVRGIYHEQPPRRASHGFDSPFATVDALKIPIAVAKHIFDNYVSKILPRYPCFTDNELWYHFGQVYYNQPGSGSLPSDISRFIVSTILATSCLTSKRQDFARVASLSESLQRDAMRHWVFLKEASIKSLQCLILLIQLGLLLPYTANLWYMSGEAVRMAIGLGFHQEVDANQGLDLGEANLRRQIFWTVYQLERTISISSGCPLAISNEHITTRLPFGGEVETNVAEGSKFQGGSRLRAKEFLLQVQLCQLQSEIYEVQFFDQIISDKFPTYEDWVKHMDDRIQRLLDHSISNDSAVPDWIVNTVHHSQHLLHRPCSRNMTPSPPSLLTATTTAIDLINSYYSVVQTSSLYLTFQLANNAFQAGVVLLYLFGNYRFIIQEASLQESLWTALNNLIQLFEFIVKRWPSVTSTSVFIRELKDAVYSNQTGSDGSAYDLNLLAELDFLVTQRRIRSVYHGNVELQSILASTVSPSQIYSPQPFSDAMWHEFIGISFDFDESYSLNLLDSSIIDQFDHPNILQPNPTEPAMGMSESQLPKDIEIAINSLPSCSFCRDKHIRCDREFPLCNTCKKTGQQCLYYDPILSQDVPRRHIHELVERIKNSIRQTSAPKAQMPMEQVSLSMTHFGLNPAINLMVPIADPTKAWINQLNDTSDHVEPIVMTNHIYFGVTSHIASISPTMALLARLFPETSDQELDMSLGSSLKTSKIEVVQPDSSTASILFAIFSRSVHIWYPVMDDTTLNDLLSGFYTEQSESPFVPHDQEVFYLVLAIGGQLIKRTEPNMGFMSAAYFEKAIMMLDTACEHSCSSSNLFLLQRTLLICIYLLLSPNSGDIWRNLGFAIRLYFDLSHRPTEKSDDIDEERLCMLSRTLYCLECQVSVAYGRPTLLAIGDKLREELTRKCSGSLQELVSIHFYKISFLRMQILSLLLSNMSSQRNMSSLRNQYDDFQEQLGHWYQTWNEDLLSTPSGEAYHSGKTIQYLKSWGDMNYNAARLMLSRFYTQGAADLIDTCCQIISTSSLLVRHQQEFYPKLGHEMGKWIPVFPMDWTNSHVMFSAAICLFHSKTRDPAAIISWEKTIRSCLTSMALMEGDPANQSLGFSEILETLYNHGEG